MEKNRDMRRCVSCMEEVEKDAVNCPYCGFSRQGKEQEPMGMRWDTVLNGRYLVGKILGQGGFGITYIGYDRKLGMKVAIKEYFPKGGAVRNSKISDQILWDSTKEAQWRNGRESFLKEARKMAKLDAIPAVVCVRDVFQENQTAYIVMNYIEGKNLKQKVLDQGYPMKAGECIRLLKPLMNSLSLMHKRGLIHRDISPDNIMVQPDGTVCLLDFGAAKDVTLDDSVSMQVAKKGFSPPEQHQSDGRIGPWTDVYALCATIYYCTIGRTLPDMVSRLNNGVLISFETSWGEALEKPVADILKDGLELKVENRIQTMDELLKRFDKKANKNFNPLKLIRIGGAIFGGLLCVILLIEVFSKRFLIIPTPTPTSTPAPTFISTPTPQEDDEEDGTVDLSEVDINTDVDASCSIAGTVQKGGDGIYILKWKEGITVYGSDENGDPILGRDMQSLYIDDAKLESGILDDLAANKKIIVDGDMYFYESYVYLRAKRIKDEDGNIIEKKPTPTVTQQPPSAGDDSYVIPNSDTVLLSRSDVEKLSLRQLNYAKNEIYARHGRKFASPELQNYFNSKNWYRGTIAPEDFSESMLSSIERKNATLLKEVEFSINPSGYPLDQ